jgi:hypothetical protein
MSPFSSRSMLAVGRQWDAMLTPAEAVVEVDHL